MADEQPDMATQWLTFDEDKRNRLLGKMTPPQQKILRRAIVEHKDFTRNPKGEGLYRVGSYDFSGGKVTKPEISVPFSRINDALAAGYQLHPDEVDRYNKDVTYQGQGPTLWERTKRYATAATEPIPDLPSPWSRGERGMGAYVRSLPAEAANLGTMPANMVTRTLRGLAGLPTQAVQTVGGIAQGDPAALEALDPATMGEGEVRNYQTEADVQHLGPYAALANVGGDVATAYLAGKVPGGAVKTLPEIKALVEERIAPTLKYAPHPEPIAGVDVPVGAGEARPSTPAGRTFTRLKRKGGRFASPRFERLEGLQQETVKDVVRSTAKDARGGPATRKPVEKLLYTTPYGTEYWVDANQYEAGKAVDSAGKTNLDNASDLYNKLDGSIRVNNDNLKATAKVTQDAMRRAAALGVDLGDAAKADLSKVRPEPDGTIKFDGHPISKVAHPELWQRLVDQGIIDDQGNGTPLKAYIKVRSELLKMQRITNDAALKYKINNEVRIMNDNIKGALPKDAYANWEEANRLWRTGRALEEVGEVIGSATKGTPPYEQARGIAPVATKMQGADLVAKLNKLDADGVLKDAFPDEEARSNLRKAADILDRSQRARVGKETEQTLTPSRSLGHALAGVKGPLAGAALGIGTELLRGGGLWPTAAGAGIGAAVGQLATIYGEYVMVKVMTTVDGVAALEDLEKAERGWQPGRVNTVLGKAAAAVKLDRAIAELEAVAQKIAAKTPGPVKSALTRAQTVAGKMTPEPVKSVATAARTMTPAKAVSAATGVQGAQSAQSAAGQTMTLEEIKRAVWEQRLKEQQDAEARRLAAERRAVDPTLNRPAAAQQGP